MLLHTHVGSALAVDQRSPATTTFHIKVLLLLAVYKGMLLLLVNAALNALRFRKFFPRLKHHNGIVTFAINCYSRVPHSYLCRFVVFVCVSEAP